MLEGWANDVVMALAGIVFGSIVSILGATTPERSDPKAFPRKPGEGYWEWTSRRVREERRPDAPRSFVLAGVAFYGFLFVFVIALVASPLQMRWWFFLGGVAVAVIIARLLPKLVQEGKIPAATDESLLSAARRILKRTRMTEPPSPTGRA